MNINKQKGIIGEYLVITDLLKRGYTISKPINEDSPYYLIVDLKSKLLKVQIKYREDLSVPNKRSYADKNGSHVKYYNDTEVDIFVITDGENIIYVPFKYRGISPTKVVSKTWGYLIDDFKYFPCFNYYDKKIVLSDGIVVSKSKRNRIKKLLNRYTYTELATRYNLPERFCRSLLYR